MSEAAAKSLSLDEFLDWEFDEDRRYEFVDGEARMMTGGTLGHNVIAINVISALRIKLRGSPCRPFGSDVRVPIPEIGNSRYPDATVDCGPFDPNAREASNPTVIFEVLSKSTAWYDQNRRLRDYEACASVRQYVCVSQSEVRVSIWLRDDRGHLIARDDITDAAAVLDLDPTGVAISVHDIYEDVELIDAATGRS